MGVKGNAETLRGASLPLSMAGEAVAQNENERQDRNHTRQFSQIRIRGHDRLLDGLPGTINTLIGFNPLNKIRKTRLQVASPGLRMKPGRTAAIA
jgi:hypothetical protein